MPKRESILVAEDNVVNRELLREILESRGYCVIECVDGQQTLDVITQNVPDLVLLDIQMPLLDGFEVVRRLRLDHRFQKLPIIAVTASAMSGEEARVLNSGFNGYLTKPIDLTHLIQTLSNTLGK
jgi:two-component system cell cycle response regulator DivK